jgi:hypothetical protein
MNLEKAFIKHCSQEKLLENKNQFYTITLLNKFYKNNKLTLFNLFKKYLNISKKYAFYLPGDVGVG